MKIKGPYLTLAAGVVLAAVLGTLSATAAADDKKASTPAAVATEVAATPSATPSSPAPTPARAVQATYAGTVVGSTATVAIAVRGDTAVAYFCDGRRIEAWLRGTAGAGQLSLAGTAGKLTGTYDERVARGTVTAGGRSWSFAVPVVHAPSGLYRATAQVRGARVVAGWIVLPNGRQVGVFTTNGGTPTPVPRLRTETGTATVNGAPLTAAAVDGSTGF